MPLSPGDRIGHYEILALIGAGGMGEVYRARDTRLKRDVALKVLPPAFARDPDRMARFRREAEVLASLNHPGIAQIYGLEENAIVMELVEGETPSGPLPVDTVVNYARQMAESLEYAHDRGVMHRDLKPSNVKVTPEGQVKLLDFGLAKAVEDPLPSADPAQSPTLTLGHTRAGAILGTAAYMSPEQAVGKPVDRRSDIFSYGAVLYELLAGQRAFTGESGPEILAAVVKSEPDWAKLPGETPEWLLGLLRRCLVKDRRQRLQAVGEARLVLENPDAGQKPGGRLKARPHIAVAVALAAGAAAVWLLKPAPPPEPRQVTRFTTSFPLKAGKQPPAVVVSGDGSRLALVADGIYARGMDQLEARLIPGTENAREACFSPDGEWIAYTTGAGRLMKAPVGGGAVLTLADNIANMGDCDWGEDGAIVFQSVPSLMRVAATGGRPETIAAPDPKGERTVYANPQLLPGARHVLFTSFTPAGTVRVLDLETREIKAVLEDAGFVRYAPSPTNPSTGYIVFGRGGSLYAAAFDVNRLAAGFPMPVGEEVYNRPGTGANPFSLSRTGTLAYLEREGNPGTGTLAWVDRQGKEEALAAPVRRYFPDSLTLSPEGGRVAITIGDLPSLTSDIWIYDIVRTTLTRLTSGDNNANPVWTPDGKRVIFTHVAGGAKREIRSIPADGSGPPVTLTADVQGQRAFATSTDGKVLLLQSGRDVLALPIEDSKGAEAKPRGYLTTPYTEGAGHFSPDGHWVAYVSNDSGQDEVYVAPYPGPGAKTLVSTAGGTEPRWNRNGRELLYREGNRVMAVDVEASTGFSAGKPKVLFEGVYGAGWDVSPDGRRFLMFKPAATAEAHLVEVHVILNWFEELRRRVPLGK
jgi:serine/threonine-protein kinase